MSGVYAEGGCCAQLLGFGISTVLRRLGFALCLIAAQPGWTLGSAAGTLISNIASVQYVTAGSLPASTVSNWVSLQVDEVIAPVLIWQDATPVAMTSPGSNGVLTYVLTNTGNGSEAFGLTRLNGPLPLPNGNYTPLNGSIGSIYLESGALAGFQASGAAADLAYVPGSNDPVLAADASITLYVLSNTPMVTNNAQGNVLLTAASQTPDAAGAAPGTALAGLGQGGGFAVVGSTRAQSSASGSLMASALGFVLNKTVLKVLDPSGAAQLVPGTLLTYQIEVILSGTGVAQALLITDPLPANTRFVPGSIRVDGVAQTDAADTDPTQWLAASQTLSVALGHVAAPATRVVVFSATIE